MPRKRFSIDAFTDFAVFLDSDKPLLSHREGSRKDAYYVASPDNALGSSSTGMQVVIVLRLRDEGLTIQRNVAGIESGILPLVV